MGTRYGGYGYGYRPYSFWGGAFVPRYGYLYPAPVVIGAAAVEEEAAPLRVTAGVEGQAFVSHFTLGVTARVEGDRWGFMASGQNIAARSEVGPGFDNLQVATAHLTFALLAGEYGRLRLEGGADVVVAPDLIAIGPTGGLSGSLYIGGPFALEGSIMVTPWPFTQVDGKIGAAVGIGPVGLRAGWRTQILDDQGAVDGVAHRDVFNGPYVGVSAVF